MSDVSTYSPISPTSPLPTSPVNKHTRNFSQATGLSIDPIEIIHDETAVGNLFYHSKLASPKPRPASLTPSHYSKGQAHQPLLKEKGWGVHHEATPKSPLQVASDRRWHELTRQVPLSQRKKNLTLTAPRAYIDNSPPGHLAPRSGPWQLAHGSPGS